MLHFQCWQNCESGGYLYSPLQHVCHVVFFVIGTSKNKSTKWCIVKSWAVLNAPKQTCIHNVVQKTCCQMLVLKACCLASKSSSKNTTNSPNPLKSGGKDLIFSCFWTTCLCFLFDGSRFWAPNFGNTMYALHYECVFVLEQFGLLYSSQFIILCLCSYW